MKFLLFTIIILLSGCARSEPAMKEVQSRTITIGISGSRELSPHNMWEQSGKHALGFVYEPLYYRSYDGGYIPVLAKKTQINENIADVYISTDVHWHDGSLLTAEDVAYTINLVASGESVYKAPLIKKAQVLEPGIVRVYFAFKVENPEIHLTFPITKAHSQTPVGTGPFAFSHKESYDTYVFEPYGKYHGKVPEDIKLHLIYAGAADRVRSLFRSGVTDGIYIEHSFLTSFSMPENAELYTLPTNHISLVGLNCISLPECVRRAIYLAADNRAAAEKAFLMGAEIFDRAWSRSLPMAHEEMKSGGFTLKEGVYCKISVAVQKGREYEEFSEIFIGQLEELGISCTVRVVDDAQKDFEKGIYDMMIGAKTLDGGLWELVRPGNFLLYENIHLQNLIKDGADEIDIKNILHRQMPFIPVALLCDGVAVREEFAKEYTPLCSFAYWSMINGGTQ